MGLPTTMRWSCPAPQAGDLSPGFALKLDPNPIIGRTPPDTRAGFKDLGQMRQKRYSSTTSGFTCSFANATVYLLLMGLRLVLLCRMSEVKKKFEEVSNILFPNNLFSHDLKTVS